MPRHLRSFAALVLMAELCSVLPLHAVPSYITNPIPVRVSHVPEWFRPTTSRLCFRALNVDPYYVPPTADQLASGAAPLNSQLLPVASWSLPNGASGLPANVALVTQGKKLVPGNCILECWLDLNDDGKFNPGEPYGCEKLYGLTPTNSISRVAIELLEVSPCIARMDLAAIISAMPSTTNTPSQSAFAPIAAATDRGRWSVLFGAVVPATVCGTDRPAGTSPIVRVRVVRNTVNGERRNGNGTSYSAILLDRYYDLSVLSTLTEADLLAGGLYDLDRGSIGKAYNPNSNSQPSLAEHLTNATYRVVIGDGDVGKLEYDGNNLPAYFSNIFENRVYQTPTVPDPALENAVYTGRPTFRWSHTNSLSKPYPDVRFRIYTNAVGTSAFWDSGVVRAPARDSSGMYAWTAPVHVGPVTNITYGGTATNVVTFLPGTTYYWRASMLDAKFTAFGPDETATAFSFAAPSTP